MSTQCAREGAGVHCGLTMETLPDRVPVLPVENYPDPIPEENATRLGPKINIKTFGLRELNREQSEGMLTVTTST